MSNIISIEEQLKKAQELLPEDEFTRLKNYIESGKHPLAPDVCAKFFELYLNGSDCKEIHRLNKGFPYEAILWARIKYNWDETRDQYIQSLQDHIKEKVIKAQLETTGLISDILVATNRRYSDKIKRYLQTGDEAELKGVLNIDSINGLLKLMDGLLKITGQDKVTKTISEVKNTTNVNINTNNEKISPETAAKILDLITEDRNKQNSS
jgi:hypothetical protein